jgi:hypothetical protein
MNRILKSNLNLQVIGLCVNCKNPLKQSEIFEGQETSYCCNNCGYEGYCWKIRLNGGA